jgi:fido (protein-threonine AMPylation protein)
VLPLDPGYGETPLDEDELEAITPALRSALGAPINKAAIYDIEQTVEAEVAAALIIDVIDGVLTLDDLLAERFLRELHRKLYAEIWQWAGVFRKRELSIGVAPEQVAAELCSSLGTVQYRWDHTSDWTAHELGVATHAEVVRVHPFTDGNGRTSRLLGDLVFVCAQDVNQPEIYDWDLEKRTYIDLLRRFDRHRDPRELAAFIGTIKT